MNSIDSILKALEAPTSAPAQTTKTASAGSALDAAIEDATAKILNAPKTASVQSSTPSPVGDLLKLANEVREADEESEVKLAHRMGAAYADGLVERMELYHAQAVQQEKTAGFSPEEHAALEKFAAENPKQYAALVKEGFFAAESPEKLAEEYDRSFVEKTAEIHALVKAHFIEGWNALDRARA